LKPMTSRMIVFDTSIFIDHLRTNKFEDHFKSLKGLIRNSAVVLSELSRGATKETEIHFIKMLAKNHPILTPTEKNWSESGAILSKIYKKTGFLPEKLRSLHFDVLIALTARSYGATVITSNRADFEIIGKFKPFRFEVW